MYIRILMPSLFFIFTFCTLQAESKSSLPEIDHPKDSLHPKFEAEMKKLSGAASINRALQQIRDFDDQTIKNQIRLTEIEAPSFKQSTVVHSDNSPRGGYGYMWWVSVNDQSWFKNLSFPPGQFSAMGYKDHVITVIPDKELVFVYNNNDKTGKTSCGDIGKLWKMN